MGANASTQMFPWTNDTTLLKRRTEVHQCKMAHLTVHSPLLFTFPVKQLKQPKTASLSLVLLCSYDICTYPLPSNLPEVDGSGEH